jgi:hypothetical protein
MNTRIFLSGFVFLFVLTDISSAQRKIDLWSTPDSVESQKYVQKMSIVTCISLFTIASLGIGNKLGNQVESAVDKTEGGSLDDRYGALAGLTTKVTIALSGLVTGFFVGHQIGNQLVEPNVVRNLSIGANFSQLTSGPMISFTYNYLGGGLWYGFPKTVESAQTAVKVNGLYGANIFVNVFDEHSDDVIKPFIGYAFSDIKENNNYGIQGSNAYILGHHAFAGSRITIPSTSGGIGAALRFGYSAWDYTHSISSQNHMSIHYNFPKLYFNLETYYTFSL